MSLNNFGDDDELLKEQPVVNDTTTPEEYDPCNIRWQMFDEIT